VAAFILPFEKPVVDLVEKVRELRALAAADARFEPELLRLEEKTSRLARELFADLSPIQKVQLSRHASRPYTLDYAKRLFTSFIELKGDRRFGEDPAIVAGMADFHGRSVVVVGHQKGRGTKENMKRNFGMPHPEGYRKALRLMKLAEKFHVPVLTFIDTQGAWAGLGAEERGQSEAIARNLYEMSRLDVPIIATVIGEGGSGGALALGVGDRVLMLENAVYSVITVEGCAIILWKDGKSPEMREKAAAALHITAQDLLELRVIDEIVPEPAGGAQADHETTAKSLQQALLRNLDDLRHLKPDKLVRRRREKYLRIGQFSE
jgi:acetyl-CoA carboxylase carboxyl transferase subunit alpha